MSDNKVEGIDKEKQWSKYPGLVFVKSAWVQIVEL